MLYDGVSLIPVFVVVVLLNLLFLQLMLFHHELTVSRQKSKQHKLDQFKGKAEIHSWTVLS